MDAGWCNAAILSSTVDAGVRCVPLKVSVWFAISLWCSFRPQSQTFHKAQCLLQPGQLIPIDNVTIINDGVKTKCFLSILNKV